MTPSQRAKRESAMCALYAKGKTQRDVGVVFGVSGAWVQKVMARAGVAARSNGISEGDRAKIERLARKGMRPAHIASAVGVSEQTAAKVMDSLGIDRERSDPGRPWTEDDDRILFAGYRALGAPEVARILGRSKNSVIGRWNRKFAGVEMQEKGDTKRGRL